MKFIYLTVFILVAVYFSDVHCMSEAQIKNAVKLVRQVCQPKFKVTNAQIDAMHKGNFEDDKNLKCYMNCGLNSLKFTKKDGKMDVDFALAQVKNLPDSLKGPVGHEIEACKDVATSSDKCESAYQIAQCMYNTEPDFYILP